MKGKPFYLVMAMGIGLLGIVLSATPVAYGLEDPGKSLELKRQELAEKEGRLKKEEERIRNIEKEVDGKIQKFTQLLNQVEEGLKKSEEFRSERLGHLVKTFEAMPPEEAALRLASLEKSLAVQIIFKMNAKKAGALLAQMEPKKVAELTGGVAKTEKKIPTK